MCLSQDADWTLTARPDYDREQLQGRETQNQLQKSGSQSQEEDDQGQVSDTSSEFETMCVRSEEEDEEEPMNASHKLCVLLLEAGKCGPIRPGHYGDAKLDDGAILQADSRPSLTRKTPVPFPPNQTVG